MGFAKLNVWVSDPDPCSISMIDWLINVTVCSGRPVKWCEPGPPGTVNFTHGSPFPAPCGHADIKLPPGCYVVSAFHVLHFGQFIFLVFTDSCIVTVGCDDSACVHLLRRSDRQHLSSAANVAARLAEDQAIPREKAEHLREALNAVLEHLPKTDRDFEQERQTEQLSKIAEQRPAEEKE